MTVNTLSSNTLSSVVNNSIFNNSLGTKLLQRFCRFCLKKYRKHKYSSKFDFSDKNEAALAE